MLHKYTAWNKLAAKALWILIIAGLLASAPLIGSRAYMERTADRVEFVFDFRDLVEIAQFRENPDAFIDEHVGLMKQFGIGAMAVYESTLLELQMSGRLKLYSASDAYLLSGDESLLQSNRTYLLFQSSEARAALEQLIVDGLASFELDAAPWEYEGKRGLVIGAAMQEASIIPLDPDPLHMRNLQQQGFRLSVRLSDARPYDQERVDTLLGSLAAYGVESIIFSGKQVTGTTADSSTMALREMAELLQKHNIVFAVIEQPPSRQQLGVAKLAYLSGYQAVRLHSILEEEAVNDAKVLADRYVLAVKDRNIRMIYLNARMKVDRDLATVTAPLYNLYDSLNNPDFGALSRIEAMGFTLGTPKPFTDTSVAGERWLKLIVLLGAIALIARTIGYYAPRLNMLAFVVGVVGVAGLYVLNSTLAVQAVALFAAVCAPTAAALLAIHAAGDRVGRLGADGFASATGWSLMLYARTAVLSLIGAVFVVGLLNDILYIYAIRLFRGVNVLAVLPMLLVAGYLAFFYQTRTIGEAVIKARDVLLLHIRVLWVVIAGICAVVLAYYLTRTGNQGSVTGLERILRAFLEDTFGVRPRNKELLAHPLFILGLYVWLRYQARVVAFVLVTIGTMAMLSIVGTFTHLHTALDISAMRVLLGLLIGVVIAAVCIVALEAVAALWRRLWPSVRRFVAGDA